MSKRILDIQGWSIYIQPKIKMKNKTSHHTVGAVQRSNIKIVERDKTKTLTYKYTTVHCPGLIEALQQKVAALN